LEFLKYLCRSILWSYLLIAVLSGGYTVAKEFKIIRCPEQLPSACLDIDLAKKGLTSSDESHSADFVALLVCGYAYPSGKPMPSNRTGPMGLYLW
jgi:hypothetical protein